MNKALIALAALIIVVGGVYFIWGGAGLGVGGQNATSTQQTATGASLHSLVAAGQPVVCTYANTATDGTKSEGTIYVAGGQVRGDINSQTQAGKVESHLIVQNNTSYVWTNVSSQGFKSTVNASQQSAQQNSVDYNTPMPYECKPWSADNSKFNLPSTISFTATADFQAPSSGAGATGAGGSGTQGTAAQCAACNSLSGAQKAQCIAALNCQ